MRRLDNITELKNFILKTVKEILNESFPKGFNFDEFAKMPQAQKLDYARKTLQDTNDNFLGSGTSRIVYRLDSKRVLKIARMSEIGAAQNSEEKQLTDLFPELFPRIYRAADDGSWLISEIVRPLSDEEEFLQLSGFTWPLFAGVIFSADQKNSIKTAIDSLPNNPEGYGYPKGTDLKEKAMGMIKKPLFRKIIQAMGADLLVGDITVLEHWGKTADGRLVILDAGFTNKSRALY